MKYVLTLFLFLFCNSQSNAIEIKVARIIDGDTFVTETGEKVRLIGINAPEITDIFGEEAKQYLAQIIEGKTVDLLVDHISNDRDRYNRLLRYVVLNGVDINKKMLLDGYAFAYLKYHFDKEEEYKQAQLEGKINSNGIWSNSNKDNILKQQEVETTDSWTKFTFKTYLLFGIVLVLIISGIYYYYKK